MTGQDHEAWTIKLLKATEICDLLNSEGMLEPVISVLARDGTFPILQEIIFSPIGADKIDYTLRDLFYSDIDHPNPRVDSLIEGLDLFDNRLVVKNPHASEFIDFIRIKTALFNEGFGHPMVVAKDILFKIARWDCSVTER